MQRRTFSKMAISMSAFGAASASRNALGANDRVRVAVLGCGVRGIQLINDLAACRDLGAEVSHVCDVWKPARERAVAHTEDRFGHPASALINYEDALSDAEVDAVVIATPDFSHARILREALDAGKDAYCEKPMAVDLAEGVAAVDAARQRQRVVQVGTQWRSDGAFIACAQAAHSGVLGRVTRLAISQNFMEPRWRKSYDDVRQEDIDWGRFLLHAPQQPFDPARFKRWYLFRDFTNGLPGLWMSHYYNLVGWLMEDPFPKYCSAHGAVYLWDEDGRETADTLAAILDYPKGWQLTFSMSLCNSADTHCKLYGTNGLLSVWDRTLSGEGGAGPNRIEETTQLEPIPSTSHMRNWIECLYSREDPRTPVEMGLAHSVAGIMTAESILQGKRLTYDAVTRTIS